MRRIILSAAIALAGCANSTPRGNPPDVSYVTAKSMEETMPCIIHGLDSIWSGYTHTAQTIAPNQEYEIRPNRQMLAGADSYFVNVKKTAENGTEVNLFATSPVKDETIPVVNRCR